MQKAARDLKVGDVVLDLFGGRGKITMRDGHTTPGVVYLYFDGHDEPPAGMVLNHGDPVRVEAHRPKLEDVIKLARQIKDEYNWVWDDFRANPTEYTDHAGFIVEGDEAAITTAAIHLLMEVE